jgi:hypothetical protein
LAILTNVTLARTNNALPDDDDVTAQKYVGAVLMLILMSFLRQFVGPVAQAV